VALPIENQPIEHLTQVSLPVPWSLPQEIHSGRPFAVEVPEVLCAEGGLLFGGWTMALAIEAAQSWSGLTVRALSAQFLSPIAIGDRLEIVLTSARQGRRVTHGVMHAAVAGVPAFAAYLVLGSAVSGDGPPGSAAATATLPEWQAPPPVPPPEACPGRTYRYRVPGSVADTMDVRLAGPEPVPGVGTGGRSLLWARVLAGGSAMARLGVLSDHVPYLIVRSMPGVRHATSVSADLRITGAPAGEWVQLEVELAAADADFCVGRVRQWSQAGALVAVSDQTVSLRYVHQSSA
jgi:acyl-CoA thioesterase